MKLRWIFGQSIILLGHFVVLAILISSSLSLSASTDLNASKNEIERIYSSFKLEEKWRLDTGKHELIERGLFDISRFVVGSEGDVYLLNSGSKGDMVSVVDKTGKLLKSFARQGQGPGELERPAGIFLTVDGNIFLLDPVRGKIVIFNREGACLKEIKSPPSMDFVYPLPDGNYLGVEPIYGAEVKEWGFALNYYDSAFRKIKELDRIGYMNPLIGKKVEATPHTIVCQVSRGRIYSAYPERGYEFLVYDLRGKLIKKITRTFRKSTDLTNYKKIIDRDIGDLSRFGLSLVYPEYVLPFYSYFTDENGYLFVMTFQPGNKEGEYLYDIISPDGDLVNTVSLSPFFSNSVILAKIFNKQLYLVKEKESGEKEIIVYRIY